MNVPYYPADDIRKVPLYVRWRIRTVSELIKNANLTLANKNKAWGVFDWSKFHSC